MHASVVIPNLNSPLIDQVLAALRAQTQPPLEVLVVGLDRPCLVHEDSLVRLIDTGKPASPARARNLGSRLARGEVICYTDADCIARPDWVERLLARHREGAVVVGGGVAVERDDYWRLCDNVLAFAPFLTTAPAGQRRYLPSLNFSIRRPLFLELGGFDEGFYGAAGEDVEFCLRATAQGHTLCFEPGAAVIHRPPRSTARAVGRHLRNFARVHLLQVQHQHGSRALAHISRRLRPWSGLLMGTAPLLGLADVLANPALRNFWPKLPGLIWGKTAWYFGLAEALMVMRD